MSSTPVPEALRDARRRATLWRMVAEDRQREVLRLTPGGALADVAVAEIRARLAMYTAPPGEDAFREAAERWRAARAAYELALQKAIIALTQESS